MMNDTIDVLDTINTLAISSINHADYTKGTLRKIL